MTETVPPVRVLVVDDNEMIRDLFSRLMSTDGRFEVVAVASSGLEAVSAFQSSAPDVVVLDYRLLDMTGIELARTLQALAPNFRAILLTGSAPDDSSRREALEAGCWAIFQKAAGPFADVLDEISAVVHRASLDGRDQVGVASASTGELSEGELDVLRHVAAGRGPRSLAASADSAEDAKLDLERGLGKLGVTSTLGAVVEARRRGLI